MMIKLKKTLLLLSLFYLTAFGCSTDDAPDCSAQDCDPSPRNENKIDQTGIFVPDRVNTIDPNDLIYKGAFRLPGGWDRPETFAYGGNAMTFNPDGDPQSTDAFSGSLFITGHDRIAYGDVPDGSQVAEVSIPDVIVSEDIADLNTAEFIQEFSNVTEGYFTDLEEIPKIGMQYVNNTDTGPKIHLAWGQHLQPQNTPSHAWFSANLISPDFQGTWFIGSQNLYSVNGYMLDIPKTWADEYVEGKVLGTGRMRDGGQGGMGPTLFAYKPWKEDGTAPANRTILDEETLLLYESADYVPDITHAMRGYQHADEWEGSAWLATEDGRSALIFAGTKATGEKYWYGYMHPEDPGKVCVDNHVHDFPTCRMADGSVCDQSELGGCCGEEIEDCISMRGWWSTRFDAEIIFYDTGDLEKVALGEMEPWEPQPYGVLDIDDYLYMRAPEWDRTMLGWGDQRRYRIGDVAYDRKNGYLYVLELFADEAKPIVHVWRIE